MCISGKTCRVKYWRLKQEKLFGQSLSNGQTCTGRAYMPCDLIREVCIKLIIRAIFLFSGGGYGGVGRGYTEGVKRGSDDNREQQ